MAGPAMARAARAARAQSVNPMSIGISSQMARWIFDSKSVMPLLVLCRHEAAPYGATTPFVTELPTAVAPTVTPEMMHGLHDVVVVVVPDGDV